nr:hypothetical protein [Paraburkholderia caledonica]
MHPASDEARGQGEVVKVIVIVLPQGLHRLLHVGKTLFHPGKQSCAMAVSLPAARIVDAL